MWWTRMALICCVLTLCPTIQWMAAPSAGSSMAVVAHMQAGNHAIADDRSRANCGPNASKCHRLLRNPFQDWCWRCPGRTSTPETSA
jgi:hypothetical protein